MNLLTPTSIGITSAIIFLIILGAYIYIKWSAVFMDKEKESIYRWLEKDENEKTETLVEEVIVEDEEIMKDKDKEHKHHPATQGGYIARNYAEKMYERKMVLHEMHNHVF